jgi:hypothetical protein
MVVCTRHSLILNSKVASAKATPAAKVPASCAVRKKKPAGKARADAEDLTARASTPITACGVEIRASNAVTLCKQQTFTFTFANDELVKTKLTRRAKNVRRVFLNHVASVYNLNRTTTKTLSLMMNPEVLNAVRIDFELEQGKDD